MIITQRYFIFTYPSVRSLNIDDQLDGYANVEKIMGLNSAGAPQLHYTNPEVADFNDDFEFVQGGGYLVFSKDGLTYPYNLYTTNIHLPERVDITKRIQFATYCGEEFDLLAGAVATTAVPIATTPVPVDDTYSQADSSGANGGLWRMDDSIHISEDRNLLIAGSSFNQEWREDNDSTLNVHEYLLSTEFLGGAIVYDMDRTTGSITPAWPRADISSSDSPSSHGFINNDGLILWKDGWRGDLTTQPIGSDRKLSSDVSFTAGVGDGAADHSPRIGQFVWGKKINDAFWNGYYIILGGRDSIVKYRLDLNKYNSDIPKLNHSPVDVVSKVDFEDAYLDRAIGRKVESRNGSNYYPGIHSMSVSHDGGIIVVGSTLGGVCIHKAAELTDAPFKMEVGGGLIKLLGNDDPIGIYSQDKGIRPANVALSKGFGMSDNATYVALTQQQGQHYSGQKRAGDTGYIPVYKVNWSTNSWDRIVSPDITSVTYPYCKNGLYGLDISDDGEILAFAQNSTLVSEDPNKRWSDHLSNTIASQPASYGAVADGSSLSPIGGVVVMKKVNNKYEFFGEKIFLYDLAIGRQPYVSLSRGDLGASGTDYSDLEIAVRYVTSSNRSKVALYKYNSSTSKFEEMDIGSETSIAGPDVTTSHNNTAYTPPVSLSEDAVAFAFPEGKFVKVYQTDNTNIVADTVSTTVAPNNFTIDSHPSDTVVTTDLAGGTSASPVTFSVTASNDNSVPVSYKWSRKLRNETAFSTIFSSNSPTLTTSNLGVERDDGSQYKVLVQAGNQTIESNPATLTVRNLVIVRQPQGTQVTDSSNANRSFSVVLNRNPTSAITLTWQVSDDNVNFSDLTGNSTSYTASSAQEAARYHRCVISSDQGLSVTSTSARHISVFT